MAGSSIFGAIKHRLSANPKSAEQLQVWSKSEHYDIPHQAATPANTSPDDEKPPAYAENDISPKSKNALPAAPESVIPASQASSSATSAPSLSTSQEKFALLNRFDTVFLIDDSASMWGPSWREVKAALRAIAPICTRYDSDGIDVYFLNEVSRDLGETEVGKAGGGFRNITTADRVHEVFSSFEPFGSTPTGKRLADILDPCLAHYDAQVKIAKRNGKGPDETGVKPLNLIVITDGEPDSKQHVKDVLRDIAKELDKLKAPLYQVGVQFFQVGNDQAATRHLAQLDDELCHGGLRDMIDTVTWDTPNNSHGANRELTADGVLKAVLGAVVRRLDDKGLAPAASRR